jgi:CelD/BcsL family acetyltransferase involved in cellulose biosynthesis
VQRADLLERQHLALSLRIVRTKEAFDALGSAWDELVSSSDRPELMSSFIWLRTWWQHYGSERDLCIGLIYAGDRLVAIAPCCLRSFRYRLGLTFRRLEWMGAAEGEWDGVASEHLGLIVAAGYERAAAHAFVDAAVAGEFGRWDECVLEMMDEDHPVVAHLADRLGELKFSPNVSATMDAPYVELSSTWEAYMASLGKKRRQSIKYALRDFEAWAGSEGCALHRSSDRSSLEQGLAIVRDLHEERWRAAGEEGAYSRGRFPAFHADIAPRLHAQDRADILWLTVGDQPVAAHYHLRLGNRVYFYQSGRKMDVPKSVRLGIVMMAYVLRDAMAREMVEFDCLGGQATYKSLFARSSRTLVRMRVARRGWRESLRNTLIRTRDFARKGFSRAEEHVPAKPAELS